MPIPLIKADREHFFGRHIAICLATAKFSPTLSEVKSNAPHLLLWQRSVRWALAFGLLLAVSLMSLQQTKVFLYFQF
jgi:hypothetical protein